MTFLALLAIAIGVLSALGLVLVGLVEMPWPVLLISLLAALFGLQRLVEASVSGVGSGYQAEQMTAEENSPAPPSPSPGITPITPEPMAAVSPKDELIYRGVRYRVDR